MQHFLVKRVPHKTYRNLTNACQRHALARFRYPKNLRLKRADPFEQEEYIANLAAG